MPTVPLVTAPVIGPSRSPNVRADPEMGNALGQAQQRLAGSIDQFAGVAAKIKHAYDGSAVTRAVTSTRLAHQDFMTSLLDPSNPDNGDPSTYAKRWDDAKKKVLDSVSQIPGVSSLSPAMRLELSTAQEDVLKQSDSAVRYATMVKQHDIAAATFQVAVNDAVRGGNEPDALDMLDHMLKTGLIQPHDAAAQRERIPLQVDEANVIKLMSQDSLTTNGGARVAEEMLREQDTAGHFVNFTRLTSEKRQAMLGDARKNSMIESGLFRQDLNDQLQDGWPKDPIKGAYLEARVKAGEAKGLLTAAQAKAYLHPNKVFDVDMAQSLVEQARQWDGLDSRKMVEIQAAAADPRVPAATREMVNDMLKPGHVFSTPEFKTALGTNQKNFEEGTYGKFSVKIRDQRTGEFSTIVNQKVLASAELFRAQIEDALKRHVQDLQAKGQPLSQAELTKFMHDMVGHRGIVRGASTFNLPP